MNIYVLVILFASSWQITFLVCFQSRSAGDYMCTGYVQDAAIEAYCMLLGEDQPRNACTDGSSIPSWCSLCTESQPEDEAICTNGNVPEHHHTLPVHTSAGRNDNCIYVRHIKISAAALECRGNRNGTIFEEHDRSVPWKLSGFISMGTNINLVNVTRATVPNEATCSDTYKPSPWLRSSGIMELKLKLDIEYYRRRLFQLNRRRQLQTGQGMMNSGCGLKDRSTVDFDAGLENWALLVNAYNERRCGKMSYRLVSKNVKAPVDNTDVRGTICGVVGRLASAYVNQPTFDVAGKPIWSVIAVPVCSYVYNCPATEDLQHSMCISSRYWTGFCKSRQFSGNGSVIQGNVTFYQKLVRYFSRVVNNVNYCINILKTCYSSIMRLINAMEYLIPECKIFDRVVPQRHPYSMGSWNKTEAYEWNKVMMVSQPIEMTNNNSDVNNSSMGIVYNNNHRNKSSIWSKLPIEDTKTDENVCHSDINVQMTFTAKIMDILNNFKKRETKKEVRNFFLLRALKTTATILTICLLVNAVCQHNSCKPYAKLRAKSTAGAAPPLPRSESYCPERKLKVPAEIFKEITIPRVEAAMFPTSFDRYFTEVFETKSNHTSKQDNDSLMRHEWARLRSFEKLPRSVPVSAIRLSQSGFYYKGNGKEAICFSCGLRNDRWLEYESVHETHKRLSPMCLFVLGHDDCNVSIGTPNTHTAYHEHQLVQNMDTAVGGACGHSREDYLFEAGSAVDKLTSSPPPIEKPEQNSHGASEKPSGFRLRHVPEIETSEQYPLRNPHETYNPDVSLFGQSSILGSAKHPEFSTKELRLSTYTGWPLTHKVDPSLLSEAGLYYAGVSDWTRCFHCSGGMRNWDRYDDPWIEHAKWFPECGFVRRTKGEEFVRMCKSLTQTSPPLSPSSAQAVPHIDYNRDENVEELTETMRQFHLPQDDEASTELEHESPELVDQTPHQNNYDDHMISSASCTEAMDILDMGYTARELDNAIRRLQEQRGSPAFTKQTIIEYLLDGDSAYRSEETVSSSPTSGAHSQNGGSAEAAGGYTGSIDQSAQSHDCPASANQSKHQSNGSDRNLTSEELKNENERLRQLMTCKICMDGDATVVFVPCGHMVACGLCSKALKKCAICRKHIKGTVRAYPS